MGFEIIIKGVTKSPNSQNITLNLRNNKITNDSISFLVFDFLSDKEPFGKQMKKVKSKLRL